MKTIHHFRMAIAIVFLASSFWPSVARAGDSTTVDMAVHAWNLNPSNEQDNNLQVFVEVSASQLVDQGNSRQGFFYYDLTVEVYDEEGDCYETKRLQDTLGTGQIDDLQNYEWTRLYNIGFTLPPGKYRLSTLLSRKARPVDIVLASRQMDIVINDLMARSFDVSDILIARHNSIQKDGVSQQAILPFPTAVFGANEDLMVVYFEIYETKDLNEALIYQVAYRNQDGKDHLLHRGKLERHSERFPIMHSFRTAEMEPGDYKVIVRLFSESQLVTIEQEATFTVYQSPTDLRFRAYDEVLQEIAFLAPDSVIEALGIVAREGRQEAVDGFWLSVDPTPGTITNEIKTEFYRRVFFASRNFPAVVDKQFSDQARVFIILGAPDALMTSLDSGNGDVLEIWEYRSPDRQIIFRDRSGFGDFRLETPLSEISH